MNIDAITRLADEALEVAGKATEGPWVSSPRATTDCVLVKSLYAVGDGDPEHREASECSMMLYWPAHPNNKDAEDAAVEKTYCNGDFIALSRTSLPLLARAVKELLPHVRHGSYCMTYTMNLDNEERNICDCGLDAALAKLGAP